MTALGGKMVRMLRLLFDEHEGIRRHLGLGRWRPRVSIVFCRFLDLFSFVLFSLVMVLALQRWWVDAILLRKLQGKEQ